mmetsp:Transcript_22443/g.57137  ORF Transcript_22443/g.57137 Transcript_22443/m.57137 type:complete len:271 (-) Transcript_22443:123-935(-)
MCSPNGAIISLLASSQILVSVQGAAIRAHKDSKLDCLASKAANLVACRDIGPPHVAWAATEEATQWFLSVASIKRKSKGLLRVVLGASGNVPRGWLGTDYPAVNFLNHSGLGLRFRPDSVHAFLAEHVFEHFTPSQAVLALQAVSCLLVSGGYLRVAVPDAIHPNPLFRKMAWGGWAQRTQPKWGYPGHQTAWTHRTLAAAASLAGLQAKPLEFWDEQGQFHQFPWRPEDGNISRSADHDWRNVRRQAHLHRYTSLIMDLVKPRGCLSSN